MFSTCNAAMNLFMTCKLQSTYNGAYYTIYSKTANHKTPNWMQCLSYFGNCLLFKTCLRLTCLIYQLHHQYSPTPPPHRIYSTGVVFNNGTFFWWNVCHLEYFLLVAQKQKLQYLKLFSLRDSSEMSMDLIWFILYFAMNINICI